MSLVICVSQLGVAYHLADVSLVGEHMSLVIRVSQQG